MNWTEHLAAAVRPLVTLGIAAMFIYLCVRGKISSEAALGVIGTIFGFWFQDRSSKPTTPAVVPLKETP